MSYVAAEPELKRVPLEECAYALSFVLAVFAAWAWIETAGLWAYLGDHFNGDHLTQMTPGFIVLAVLSFVVQIASNVAAAAARQAKHFGEDMRGDFERARALMVLGGAYNAVSLHHAFELIGFLNGGALEAAASWAISAVLAFYEPAQYWTDQALKVALATRRAATEALALSEARDRDDARFRLQLEANSSRAASETPPAPVNLDTSLPGRRRRARAVQKVALGTVAAISPGGVPALAANVEPPAIVQQDQRPVIARDVTVDEIEQAREALARRGVTPSFRTVAAHLCVRKCDVERAWPRGVPLATANAA